MLPRISLILVTRTVPEYSISYTPSPDVKVSWLVICDEFPYYIPGFQRHVFSICRSVSGVYNIIGLTVDFLALVLSVLRGILELEKDISVSAGDPAIL